MKRVFLLPFAAVFVVACAEPTSPVDFSVAAGKQTQPPAAAPGETFETGVASLSAWSSSSLATSPGTPKLSATNYLGQFVNDDVTLNVIAGSGNSVTISFDLYIVGTWDGAGQQGFGSDEWQIEVRRNGGALENVFHTSFSNQATKPQHFPKEITGGTSPNGRGALMLNALGYPKASAKFDVGDAIYRLTYTVSNASGEALQFRFHSPTGLQGNGDESWGIDNVTVTRQ